MGEKYDFTVVFENGKPATIDTVIGDISDYDDDGDNITITDQSLELGLHLNNEQKCFLRKELKRARSFANRVDRAFRRRKRKEKEAKKKARKEKFGHDILSGVR